MNRDPLTEALAREIDAQDREAEPRWEERERGKPRLAGGESADADEDLAAALFRPLDAPALARLQARIEPLVRQGPAGEGLEPAKVVSMPKRRRAAVVAILAPIALAAGLVLYVTVSPSRAPLPDYQLNVIGGAQPLRHASPGAPDAPIALIPGSQLEIVARPSTVVTGPVGARAFFMRGDDLHPWNPTMEISPEGAVRATGAPSSWSDLTAGTWELVVLIGRPDTLPGDASGAKRVIAAPDRGGVHMLRHSVEVLR